jgi:hypothetical protein
MAQALAHRPEKRVRFSGKPMREYKVSFPTDGREPGF